MASYDTLGMHMGGDTPLKYINDLYYKELVYIWSWKFKLIIISIHISIVDIHNIFVQKIKKNTF